MKQCPMVRWFDPRQLLRTGFHVLVSSVLGQHSDVRTQQSHDTPDDLDLDLGDADEFWFDYVADTGDGFNSTYAIASEIARPLEFTLGGHRYVTKPGSLLVFGGDLVYPAARSNEYAERFIAPYTAALGNQERTILAIPGNHDWYDSLQCFSQMFLSDSPPFGTASPQRRSYFAAKLPHGWWLFGVDLQLTGDIDFPQLRYFEACLEKVREGGGRVLLMSPEPYWIKTERGKQENESRKRAVQERLERNRLQMLVDSCGDRLGVAVAGDIHHYVRYEHDESKEQRITAGGGGAFLHPTHVYPDRIRSIEPRAGQTGFRVFDRTAAYPDAKASCKMTRGNLLFFLKNPGFGLVTAVMYLLIAWTLGHNMGLRRGDGSRIAEVGELGISKWCEALAAMVNSLLVSPLAFFFALILFSGFWFFTDNSSRQFRFLGGTLHALTHLVAAFAIYWALAYLAITEWCLPAKSIQQYLVTGVLIPVAGFLVGPIIMGFYLLISLNWCSKHSNEAFSALRIEDWKCFLRFQVTQTELKIFPIGIRRVPRAWKHAGAKLVPDDTDALPPHLIEPPVSVPRNPCSESAREPSWS